MIFFLVTSVYTFQFSNGDSLGHMEKLEKEFNLTVFWKCWLGLLKSYSGVFFSKAAAHFYSSASVFSLEDIGLPNQTDTRLLFLVLWFSSDQITFKNEVGQYDLEVTTFQLAVLFAWNQRPRERISFENLKLATELPDAELRRTLWVRPKFFTYKLNQKHRGFKSY